MMFGVLQNGQTVATHRTIPTSALRNVRRELIEETVQFLLGNAKADRVGVWMDNPDIGRSPGWVRAGFHGVVADRNGEATPSEWDRLSPEAPLPSELLNDGKSVELELSRAPNQALLGALVDLRRAVWVPLAIRGRLRGVLFAGSRKKHGKLPVRLLESASAELSSALELDEQQRLARHQQADLDLVKAFLDEMAQSGPTDGMLARWVESCTNCGPDGAGLCAVFAELRLRNASERVAPDSAERDAKPEMPGDIRTPGHVTHAVAWQSGDPAWLHALRSRPLADIWTRARETRATVSIRTGPGTPWPRGDVVRLVAINLQAGGETLGVLAVGFRFEATSQITVERLEVRAAVLTSALHLRERNKESATHKAHLQTLLRANSLATILVDGDGAIAGLSRGAREMLGEAPEEASEESRPRNIDGSKRQMPRREFRDIFLTCEQSRVESWLHSAQTATHNTGRTGDRHEQVQLQSGVCARLRCDQPGAGLIAVVVEPMPDKQETSSRHPGAERQLLHVIEWLDEGVLLFDAEEGIRAMNGRFGQLAGLAPEQIGRITTLHALISALADQAAEPEKFARGWRDLARGLGSGIREEIQLVRPISRVLERTTRPVLSPEGRRIGRMEIYRDLTAQRALQSKLAQSEKLAALGQMVTGVAHELSNPLTSILGYAQRLFLRGPADGQADEIRQIFQEAQRASTIVRQLLMSARESRPERRRVSLNQIVSRTIDLQKVSLSAERVTVELNLDAALPFVVGDAGQLQQVLMNLVGNARQAIEQGGRGGTIRIATKCIDGGCSAQLEVSDDGPGIPEAISSRIFDPFFTTKPAGIGTGLGLAIVLGVVREHGGHVKVSSPTGGGAIFCVELPAETAAQQCTSAVSAFQSGSSTGDVSQRADYARRSRTRVLVVEDEPTVARLISDVLQAEGFQVDALLDGQEALERAARQSYDLVVCDMKMPGLDGQRFYETLASAGNPLFKRFLFVTGDVLSSHTHEFLDRHQLSHVAKPFRVEELTEKVRRMLLEVPPRGVSCAAEAGRSVSML